MKLIQLKFLMAVLLLSGTLSRAQFKTTIPLNEEVVSGTLKNGMKYYILHNEWPAERVSFYFAQNVGAILEDDTQNGLAHFLEHMAFNGTQNFEGKAIIEMLEKSGVSFGKDINAYTAKDQTVYNISNVPSKDVNLIDKCLLVLHDWSGSLSLNEQEIDAERGVIREEWRTRNTAEFRIGPQTDKILYKGSKYASRDVIGDINIINNFKYQELKDYYKKWYRPDLQSVIVVGDIDPKVIEQKIIKLFSTIEMPKNATERYYVEIPDNKEMEYVLATDKEAQQIKINLLYRKKNEKVKSTESLKRELTDFLATSILNRRYEELVQSGVKSAIGFGTGMNEISRLETSFNLVVVPKNGREKEAFKDMLIEMEKASRFGFNERELDLQKENVQSFYDNLLRNKNKISNDNYAQQLTGYFLTAAPFESIPKQIESIKAMLSSISLQDVNTAVKGLRSSENSLLLVTGPAMNNTYPSKEEYFKIMEEVKRMPLEKNKETAVDFSLNNDIQSGSILKESKVKSLPAASTYVLSNGATVILYPTKLAQDEVLFSAVSKGGNSLLQTQEIPSSQIAVDLIEASGLAKLNNTQLKDKLNGKIVSVSPFIDELTEGFNGSSSKRDTETLLNLLHLYFENPRFDNDAYVRLIEQYKNDLANSKSNSDKIFRDSISLLNTNYSKRAPIFNEAFIDQLDFKTVERVYLERIKNAGDFTFILVGNLPDNILELVQKYIGSIASQSNKKETFIDHKVGPADGLKKSVVSSELEIPKASIYVKFLKEADYNYKDTYILYMISELLSKRYREIIREQEGGSYGVNVQSEVKRLPANTYALTIDFDSDPEKQSKLTKVVYDQIDIIKKSVPDKSEVESIKRNLLKMRAERILSNNFWMNNLKNVVLFNEDFKDDVTFKKTIAEIKEKDIKNFAVKFFNNPKTVEVIMKTKS